MQYHLISIPDLRRYKLVSEGKPPGKGEAGTDFDQVCSICDALVRVNEVTDLTTIVQCKANPFNLVCECASMISNDIA